MASTQRMENSIEKLNELKKLMQGLIEKDITSSLESKTTYNGLDLLEEGTYKIQYPKYGVEIDNKELKPFMDYIEKINASDIIINLQTYKDRADVSLITLEKVITMYLNYENPITKKNVSFVNVHNTDWKLMQGIGYKYKRQSLIERILITSAILVEQEEHKEFKTKKEFITYFKKIKPTNISTITKRIELDGKLSDIDNITSLDITYDNFKIEVLKFIYNSLYDESQWFEARCMGDKTYVTIRNNKNIINFDISLTKFIIRRKI